MARWLFLIVYISNSIENLFSCCKVVHKYETYPLNSSALQNVRWNSFSLKRKEKYIFLVQLLKQFIKNRLLWKLWVYQQRKWYTIEFVELNYVVTKCPSAAAFCCPVWYSYHDMFVLCVCPSFLEWGYLPCIIFHSILEEFVLKLAVPNNTIVNFYRTEY